MTDDQSHRPPDGAVAEPDTDSSTAAASGSSSEALGTLVQRVMGAQVDALRRHEAGVREASDIEAVHQMRVATRRLRAALRVFRDALAVPSDELRSELAWFADQLGAVRDLDVQLEEIGRLAAEVGVEATGLRPIEALLREQRASAQAALIVALDDPRYVSLVESLCDAIKQPAEHWPEVGRAPASEGLPELIRGRYRRFRKAARTLAADCEVAELHRARIRAKQLRYTLEFVSDVYGKSARRLIRRTVAVQDLLGGIHDAAVLGERLHQMAAADHLPAESVFVLGQLAQFCATRSDTQRQAIPKTLRRVGRKRWRKLRSAFEPRGPKTNLGTLAHDTE